MKSQLPRTALVVLVFTTVASLSGDTVCAAPSMKTVVDFQALSSVTAWEVVNDDVMGGISRSRFTLSNGVGVFQGEVSLENNGGFASVRSLPAGHNLDGAQAFVIRFRGDGKRYKFTVRTAAGFDGVIYQCAFPTRDGVWEEHRLPLREFTPTFRGRVLSDRPPLDPAAIRSVGFLISDKQQGPFRLEVAWIKAEGG